ncbi:MAG: lamin tail domain-containing protein [Planctomycetota bacterium]
MRFSTMPNRRSLTRRLFTAAALAGAALALPATDSDAEVVISEIMYNPASFEGFPAQDGKPGKPNKSEWVELYNTGTDRVDLTGYRLSDEEGQTGLIPGGVKLEPQTALVLIPAEQSIAEFQKAWGEGFRIVRLTEWGTGGMSNLSNSPSPSNETLNLLDASGSTVDSVNFDDESPWPSDDPHGPSIYVLPGQLDNNDQAGSWARSAVGVHEAKAAIRGQHFRDQDIGSPGVVAVE